MCSEGFDYTKNILKAKNLVIPTWTDILVIFILCFSCSQFSRKQMVKTIVLHTIDSDVSNQTLTYNSYLEEKTFLQHKCTYYVVSLLRNWNLRFV